MCAARLARRPGFVDLSMKFAGKAKSKRGHLFLHRHIEAISRRPQLADS